MMVQLSAYMIREIESIVQAYQDREKARVTRGLHPETAKLVQDFTTALSAKLAAAEAKYGYSDDWRTNDWQAECQRQLQRHVDKGDPLDVAAYSAFCWAREWKTSAPEPTEAGEWRGMERLLAAIPSHVFWQVGHDGEGPDPSLFKARLFAPMEMVRPVESIGDTAVEALSEALAKFGIDFAARPSLPGGGK